jgi:transposase
VEHVEDSKTGRLRERKVLNPLPATVTDELFLSLEFFDAEDLVQVKYEMVRRVERDGWTVERAAKTFGFSRPTYYETKKIIDRDGIGGLVPRKKGPKSGHKLTDEVMRYVDDLTGGGKARVRTREILSRIEEEFGVTVHRRSLERARSRWKKKR